MGKEYLTEMAVFACPLGMRYKAEEIANTKAKYKGKKLLTSSAVLLPKQSPIPCTFLPPLPSGPTPCPCTMIPILIQSAVRHRAAMNLLTMDAKAVCLAGKSVKPIQSGVNAHVVYKGANSARIADIIWPAAETKTKSEAKSKKAEKSSIASIKSSSDTEHKSVDIDRNETPQRKNVEDTTSKATLLTDSREVIIFRDGMLCSHSKNKPECLECIYRLDNATVTVDNNSVILRKNYNATKPHNDSYDIYFDDVVEPMGNSKPKKWSYAAHHLISGNQVFKQNAELVRLAHFCGYDINGYENCIMLVGYPEGYPDMERMKSVKAYEVMSESRVQWHVGGHSYRFTEEEKAEICKQVGIRNKIELTPGDIKTYAELVQLEVEKLLHRLETKKNHHHVCYVDSNEKRQLCEKLNRISQRIKAKLANFRDVGKPHHSFPFFVSKEAYLYTYALPRTGKVITVLKEGSKLTLSMFRLEHFTEAIASKNKSLKIKAKDKACFDLSGEAWAIECIFFCSNVDFFIYLDDTPRDILPFTVDKNHQFPTEVENTGKDGQKFLEERDTEILVWLRDNPQYGYVSPALMVKTRSEEYLFGKEVS